MHKNEKGRVLTLPLRRAPRRPTAESVKPQLWPAQRQSSSDGMLNLRQLEDIATAARSLKRLARITVSPRASNRAQIPAGCNQPKKQGRASPAL
jgi:hypothetical protein